MAERNRISRKKALSMEEVMADYIREMRLASGMNTHLVFKAWDEASGAAEYTLRKFYRDGVLTVTLSSSMVRSALYFQRADLVRRINGIVGKDPLFTVEDGRTSFVKELILK